MRFNADENLTAQPPAGQILIYEDGGLNLQVRLDGQTVWLTQAGMAELFQTTPQNITMHLATIYEDGELDEAATCKEFLQVRMEGQRTVRRNTKHYNLDAILAVGMRVRSARGTVFRQWAIARLGELLVKGFTMDDERLKAGRTLFMNWAGFPLGRRQSWQAILSEHLWKFWVIIKCRYLPIPRMI